MFLSFRTVFFCFFWQSIRCIKAVWTGSQIRTALRLLLFFLLLLFVWIFHSFALFHKSLPWRTRISFYSNVKWFKPCPVAIIQNSSNCSDSFLVRPVHSKWFPAVCCRCLCLCGRRCCCCWGRESCYEVFELETESLLCGRDQCPEVFSAMFSIYSCQHVYLSTLQTQDGTHKHASRRK